LLSLYRTIIFGSKEKLFQAMFDRRSRQMNDLRLAQLSALLKKGRTTLEQLLDVLLRPAMESGRDIRRTYFSRLIVATALSPRISTKS